eukprot:Gregarina_sp_Poly_1__861@NODE_1205_length_4786_cov_414_183725_g825_i0_p4_GENE_NODE_1205_length_4786_cov_414_183725_g825_i0NODE_1205_length_4786_cov_414_183725_g825_i0_p4_ORF_typecomplete_len255_score17_82FYVE_2/PF02318_16/0_023Auto_antip27/PF06677_12/1_5Auto_antip27/PF06677_12/0_33Cytochrom_CIII/PF02085_16/63Cytochrom_CIII/PF02085_16/7_1_NODE_1205_length_4786_cov_414_183725_g825_i038344598
MIRNICTMPVFGPLPGHCSTLSEASGKADKRRAMGRDPTMKQDICRHCHVSIMRTSKSVRCCKACETSKNRVPVRDRCRDCNVEIMRDRKKARICSKCKRQAEAKKPRTVLKTQTAKKPGRLVSHGDRELGELSKTNWSTQSGSECDLSDWGECPQRNAVRIESSYFRSQTLLFGDPSNFEPNGQQPPFQPFSGIGEALPSERSQFVAALGFSRESSRSKGHGNEVNAVPLASAVSWPVSVSWDVGCMEEPSTF